MTATSNWISQMSPGKFYETTATVYDYLKFRSGDTSIDRSRIRLFSVHCPSRLHITGRDRGENLSHDRISIRAILRARAPSDFESRYYLRDFTIVIRLARFSDRDGVLMLGTARWHEATATRYACLCVRSNPILSHS